MLKLKPTLVLFVEIQLVPQDFRKSIMHNYTSTSL